jgi:hypothetical protein
VIGQIDLVFVLSNQIEAALWMLVAIAMTLAAVRRARFRFDCIVGAVAFALFGVSDLVETTTGAWWQPWWLLAWKAACLFAFLWLLKRYVIRRTPDCGSSTSSHRSARAQNPCPPGSR